MGDKQRECGESVIWKNSDFGKRKTIKKDLSTKAVQKFSPPVPAFRSALKPDKVVSMSEKEGGTGSSLPGPGKIIWMSVIGLLRHPFL